MTQYWTKRTEWAAKFSAVALESHDLVTFALSFTRLAITCPLDDECLKSLFWIGVNCHRPVDLPDTTGLNCREAIIRCLESVLPRFRTPPDPEPSPPSPRCAKQKPEPTATDKPSPRRATEPRIAPEPEPETSDKVRDPATVLAMREIAMDSESSEGSSAHCTIAEGELSSVDCILPALPSSSSACTVPSICPKPSICPEPYVCLEISVCPELSVCPV